jgi:ATP-binding cassette subfamily B protein
MRKFKIIKQYDAMQCGIASLAMICAFYGRYYSLKTLSGLCISTHEGSSLKGIKDASEKLGLEALYGYISIEDLQKLTGPIILHWDQNHFVVLYRIDKKNQYYIGDPARGKVKYSEDNFKRHWISVRANGEEKGIAMYLKPTDAFYQHLGERAEERSVSFLFSYTKKYRKYLFQIFLSLLLCSVLQLIIPILTQWIVDIGIRYKDVTLIWLILLGELVIVTGRTVADFVRRWLLLHISMRVNISLVSDFFIKLFKLPMAFFDCKMMGDLRQRIEDHARVQSFLTRQTLGFVFVLLNFVVLGFVLFVYNIRIFSIFLFGSIVYATWIFAFLRRRKELDYRTFEQQAKSQNLTYQLLSSMQEIKLQDCEQRRRWEWEDIQADLSHTQMDVLKLQQSQEAGGIFINEIKNIVITASAATAVINGTISLGTMLAIQYIVGQLNSPIEQMMSFIYSFQDIKISLERINEIHKNPDEDNNTRCITSFGMERAICFEHVCFKYDPHSVKDTIRNASFKIPGGKVTAIVGASGSGKTTLVKLMLGYYPVLSGAITIAGSNVNDYNLKWWRRHCGVVMQDGVVFSDSIANNIAVGDGELDSERLEYAAKMANIHDYVMSLPLKYNTRIGMDGMGLSQGQKQRILIARAVYKNPDFIFLDEATNSLDAKNERAIVENLDDFYKGRTVVVVAHRLSTVKNAGQIIVMDSGRIVEIGNHDSLIRREGVYYNLVKNQLELGK